MRRPRREQDLKEFRIVEKIKKSEKYLNTPEIHEHDIKIAVIFPDSYIVGVANLGFQRVWQLLNNMEGVQAERFYFDEKFSKYYSLDTFRPLDEFDIWAFSVSFEMNFHNIKRMLEFKNIPLKAIERNDKQPMLMIGGAVTYFNTNALWQYADIIFHGDAEDNLADIVQVIQNGKRGRVGRDGILTDLETFDNISIPPHNKENTNIAKSMTMVEHPAVSSVISRFGSFGERVLIEIGRGCIRKCSFCVAGHTRKPARFVKPSTLETVFKSIKANGFNSCGLISATFTDHPQKDEILKILEKEQLNFSVSSLRLDSISDKLIAGLLRSGQKEMTIAPEGGTQKIRDLMNKEISETDIERALMLIRGHGLDSVKMYFIYGLEEEDEGDLKGFSSICDLALKIGFKDIKLSFNPLIPKPETPFSNREIQDLRTLKFKKKIIQESLRGKAKAKFESIRNSVEQYRLANATKEIQL